MEQPAQEVARMSLDDLACHASSTIGRSCFRPGPCCGNRHGQCFQLDWTTTVPGAFTWKTFAPGRTSWTTRVTSSMIPLRLASQEIRSMK
jgi:hypothetical protein